MVVVIVPVLFCLLKGKIWTGVIGLFVPLVAIVGAIRLARLNSPWARRRYRKKPKKLAKAQRREARLDARWIAWRDAFFDLIAGKPHLPSLPPLGPDGKPLTGRRRRARRGRRSDAHASADAPTEPAAVSVTGEGPPEAGKDARRRRPRRPRGRRGTGAAPARSPHAPPPA